MVIIDTTVWIDYFRGVTNPDKLEHLGPVVDAREVLRKNRP